MSRSCRGFAARLTLPLLFAAGLGVQAPAQAETLVFAPLPMKQPEEIVKHFKPMLAYLEQTLGMTIQVDYSSSYEDILKKFRSGKLDMAYLGPLPYVTLKEGFAPATPLVHFLEKSGKPSYTCAIVTGAGGKPLAGLKGAKIALTQPLSTCGYLSTDGLLHRAGSALEHNKYRYLDKHDEVALAVARGDFDAGGLKTSIAKQFAHLGVNVVAETAPLPSFALIANSKKLSAKRMAELREALTRLQPQSNPADKATMQQWGDEVRYGAVAADDKDYDPVRQLRKRVDIPQQGNF